MDTSDRRRTSELAVTAYLPCYNVARYISAAIEGLLVQSVQPAEIVIIDDGCTDDTIKIASRFHVRIVRHDRNRGLAAARNTALREAHTPLIASLDTDAVPEPDWLERLLPYFRDPCVAGVMGRMLERYQERLPDRWRAIHMAQHWGDEPVLNPPALSGSNNIFRREALLKIGGYCEEFRTNYEDCNVSYRLREEGYSLMYEPAAVVYHQRQDTVRSVMRTSWNWDFYLRYYRGDYSTYRRLWKDVVTSFYFVVEDWRAGEGRLVPLDFFRAVTHLWWDFRYFLHSGRSSRNPAVPTRGSLSQAEAGVRHVS